MPLSEDSSSPKSILNDHPSIPFKLATSTNDRRDNIVLSQLDLTLPIQPGKLADDKDLDSGRSSIEQISINNNQIYGQYSDDEEEQYVEFDFGGSKSGIVSTRFKKNSSAEIIKYGKGNRTNSSLNISQVNKDVKKDIVEPKVVNNNDIILSEEEDEEIFSDNDPDWREMGTEMNIDMYNEKGELIKNNEIFLQDNKELLEDGSKLGYTRIANEEQVTKFNKMNEEFDFLFSKDIDLNNLDKLTNDKKKTIADEKIFFDIDDHQNHTSEDNSQLKEDEVTTVSQLNSTKEMLKESQKIAYVGLVKLIIVDMAISMSKLHFKNKSMKSVKKMSTVHLSFQHWSMKMMDRLYLHMDLNEHERHMIEVLSSHGVEPKDLTPSLVTVETLQNPLLNNPDKEYLKTGENEELSNDVLNIDIKWTLVCDLFLNLIFDAVYDSRSRTLLLKFAEYLNISNLEICQFERRVTDLLEIEESSEQIWNEKEILDFRLKANRRKQFIYIGLATIGGSLIIGLSAGLLAPVIGAGIAAGLTSIGIAGTSGFLAGVGGTTIVTTVGVLSGASIGRKGMLKRVGNVKTFEFRPIHNHRRVNLILTVSGWMMGNEDDVRLPFSTVDPVMGDIFSLLWEPEMLKSTGQTINILATEILTQSIQQILGNTILIAFMASMQWPMLLSKLGYLLDNPWNVSLDRAWAAGIILADTLIQRNLGVRPITLVGFSLGARLIYSCLLELSKRGAFGLVEDVILFGAPLVFKLEEISLARSIVSGRFVNGYSKKDWILGYLFRATSGGLGTVAGLTLIEGVEGIENFDCTEFVNGHMEYRKQIPKLLKELNWEVLNEEFVEIDEPEDLERQRELINEFENVQDELDKKKGKGKKKFFKNWFKPKPKEWWEVYDEGRKEVEKKQKLAEAAKEDGDDDTENDENSLVENSLFDLDAIAKEVANIEKQILDDDDDGTLVGSTQLTEEFQPRSFKTKSVESTPVEETVIRENRHAEELGKRKSSNLLQKIILDDVDEGSSSQRSASLEIAKETVGDDKDEVEDEVEDRGSIVIEDKPTVEVKEEKVNFSYYDDDDEFNNTGQEIKMTFA